MPLAAFPTLPGPISFAATRRELGNDLDNEWFESGKRSAYNTEIELDGGPVCGGGGVVHSVVWMLGEDDEGV